MSQATSVSLRRFCVVCGQAVGPGARFCRVCGAAQVELPDQPEAASQPPPKPAAAATLTPVAPPIPSTPTHPAGVPRNLDKAPAPSPSVQPFPGGGGPESAAEPRPSGRASSQPPALQSSGMGFQVKLLDAGPYRGRVLVALRQLLQLDGASAARFVASAPVVVAVCGAPDAAERLRATLVGAGANVQVAGPPPAPRLEPVKPPKPEPRRYMAATARAVREPRAGRGVRTLTGLALGRGGTYLAFGRADASRLLAIPDLIRVEARVMVPTAVRLAGDSSAEIFGNEALQCWIEEPDEVSFGFIEDLSGEEDRAARATRGFLKFLKDRLVEVLGPGAVDAAAGAATAVAIPPEWPETQSSRLAAAVEQAGFPLTHLVPEPLAAVAAYVQQKREPVLVGAEHYLVIDWGSQGLDISVVESGPGGAWMTVIDHVEYPLGGMWFDMILENWLAERLGAELSDEDRRALSLFARLFKEEASLSFSESRTEHVQYCVVPAGMPPTRLSISKTEMDALFQDARAQFQTAVAEAPARLGFRPEHFDQVLLAGGAARWYFAGDAVRTALCRSSVVARDPEEVIARGLVLGAVRQGAETCPSK